MKTDLLFSIYSLPFSTDVWLTKVPPEFNCFAGRKWMTCCMKLHQTGQCRPDGAVERSGIELSFGKLLVVLSWKWEMHLQDTNLIQFGHVIFA